MAWTTPRTWVAGNVLAASELNTDVRDNLLALDSGRSGLVDAKGDLLAGSAADTLARLAVGSDGQVLTASAAAATGLAWAAAGGLTEVAYAETASTVTSVGTFLTAPAFTANGSDVYLACAWAFAGLGDIYGSIADNGSAIGSVFHFELSAGGVFAPVARWTPTAGSHTVSVGISFRTSGGIYGSPPYAPIHLRVYKL